MDFQRLLIEWPAAIPKSGTALTSFGDAIPFSDFALNGELVLFCRSTPDAQGTLREIVHARDINAIKFHEAIPMARFLSMGFQKPEESIASSFS